MLFNQFKKVFGILFLFSSTITPMVYSAERGSEEVRLANGFRAIIIENHNAPVIASVVMVHTGSSRENYTVNGVSHMLEHLLFNGTKKRTQKELYAEQDAFGIYNNAHTTEEYTNYMALSNKEHFSQALDIQSDMLFNSIIPKNKFEKEKGIVLNEIAMNKMNDDYLAQKIFKRQFFHGSPFNLTVLGLPETIRGMDRQTVLDFYKRHYVPNNMTAIVMGDFHREEMLEKIKKYFGNVSPGLLSDFHAFSQLSGRPSGMHLSKKKVNKVIIHMAAKAPPVESNDFFSYNLLVRLVAVDFKDRVNSILRSGGHGEVLDASINMDLKKGFSALLVGLTLPPTGDVKEAVAAVKRELEQLPAREFSSGTIRGIISSLKMGEISMRERIHYFGMMASAKIAVGGWSFARDFIENLGKVSVKQVRNTAQKHFPIPSFFVSAMVPGGQEREISEVEKKEYYTGPWKSSSFSPESRSLVKNWKPSQVAGVGLSGATKGEKTVIEKKKYDPKDEEPSRTILANGLTVLVKKAAPGGVFAAHVLVKGRSKMEPAGKEGMAELLHSLLDKGTKTRDREKVRSDLMAIGAKIKTVDNPQIPYDDYYLSSEYSYIRFETMEEYFEEGLKILSDLIRNPLLAPRDVEREKNNLISIAKDKAENARTISIRLLYSALVKGSGYERPVHGIPAGIKSISTEDLKQFHGKYFSPQNLIISIISGLDSGDVLKNVKLGFGDMTGPPLQSVKKTETEAVKTEKDLQSKTIRKKLGKSQSFIRMGKIIKVAPDDKAAVNLLSLLLSNHIVFQLREKEGLSYSLWAGFMKLGDVDMFSAAIGTTPDKIESAREGLLREIANFRSREIKQEDIQKFINQSGSRHMMRAMTRIGQAYGLGIAEFSGKARKTFAERANEMEKVTAAEVQSASQKYLDMDGLVTVIVE